MPKVFFRFPYGDFPEFKQGDICDNPTPEMLKIAETSTCLEIIEDAEPATEPAE